MCSSSSFLQPQIYFRICTSVFAMKNPGITNLDDNPVALGSTTPLSGVDPLGFQVVHTCGAPSTSQGKFPDTCNNIRNQFCTLYPYFWFQPRLFFFQPSYHFVQPQAPIFRQTHENPSQVPLVYMIILVMVRQLLGFKFGV